jgi:hypothetical protein
MGSQNSEPFLDPAGVPVVYQMRARQEDMFDVCGGEGLGQGGHFVWKIRARD